ncbi:hypothetical protein JYT48_00300 [Mariprofundus ferrooxydans]|nr:hypothetical protein [Mariprofundus ferrooxydans]
MRITMKIIQSLLLTFIIGCLPSIASAKNVTATMLVSMNVIPVCSISFEDDIENDFSADSSINIRCGQSDIHRISTYYKRSHHHAYAKYNNDDDEKLTTIEF